MEIIQREDFNKLIETQNERNIERIYNKCHEFLQTKIAIPTYKSKKNKFMDNQKRYLIKKLCFRNKKFEWNICKNRNEICLSKIKNLVLLYILRACIKSNKFSIEACTKKNNNECNEDIINTSELLIHIYKDEIVISLGTIMKNYDDKKNKIAIIFPAFIFIPFTTLDAYQISFNNEADENTRKSQDLNLYKTMNFLHKISLKTCLNKNQFITYATLIITLLLKTVNSAEKYNRCANQFQSVCTNLTYQCLSPPIGGKDLCNDIWNFCKDAPEPIQRNMHLGKLIKVFEFLEDNHLYIFLAIIIFLFIYVLYYFIELCYKKNKRRKNGWKLLEES